MILSGSFVYSITDLISFSEAQSKYVPRQHSKSKITGFGLHLTA